MKTNYCVSYGEKGGVGKTTNSIFLADIIRIQDIPFGLYDCDKTNPILSRFMGLRDEDGKKIPNQDPTKGVKLQSLDKNYFLPFLNNLPEFATPVLLDFPATGTLKTLDDEMAVSDFLRGMDIPTTIFFSTDGLKDSIAALKRAMKRYDFARFVLFLSERFDETGEFPDIHDDEELQSMFAANKTIQIHVPELPLALVRKLHKENLRPSIAISPGCDKLFAAERFCLAAKFRKITQNMQPALDLFKPKAE